MKKSLYLIGIVALFGCAQGDEHGPPGIDVAEVCAEVPDGRVEVVVTAGGGDAPVSQDLLVRGTAAHTEELTIRTLTVGGVPAANDGFNFDTWSATVPFLLLQTATTTDPETGNTTLAIVAKDACDRRFESSFELRVAVLAKELHLVVDYPGEEEYLPADGTTAAALSITADAAAVGAKVQLATTGNGVLAGATAGLVTLAGDKSAPATATVLFTSSKEGTAVVTAAVEKLTAILPIVVAGPPTLLPGAGTIKPGQTVSVTVTTQGRVKDCQATPAAGILVTSGGNDLMKTPAAVDENGDGKPDLQIKVDPALAIETQVTVVCRDPYGQATSGTYTAMP